MTALAAKWERAQPIKFPSYIVSSDFPKYQHQPWKFMDGRPRMEWVLSNEYCRKFIEERDIWAQKMYGVVAKESFDIVKNYVLSFKDQVKPRVQPKKQVLFVMKRFQGIPAKTSCRRPKDDEAMIFNKGKFQKMTKKTKTVK